MTGIDHATQWSSRSEQFVLSDNLRKFPGPHPIGQRPGSCIGK